jgi:hypothetical protein
MLIIVEKNKKSILYSINVLLIPFQEPHLCYFTRFWNIVSVLSVSQRWFTVLAVADDIRCEYLKMFCKFLSAKCAIYQIIIHDLLVLFISTFSEERNLLCFPTTIYGISSRVDRKSYLR